MNPHDRQAARDRAADAIAPRERIICGPKGWAPALSDPMLSAEERKRRSTNLSHRRTRARRAQ